MAFDPTAPKPDTKDWTWVVGQRCDFCEFDGRLVTGPEVSSMIPGLVSRWVRVLERDSVAVRPAAEVWSPLEYGCHVRDVFEIFAGRATLILTDDEARFADWDQDATALEQKYWLQKPGQVADELAAQGRQVSGVFAAVPDGAWDRVGRRSNGSVFTVDTLGRYMVHDVVHHLADVRG